METEPDHFTVDATATLLMSQYGGRRNYDRIEASARRRGLSGQIIEKVVNKFKKNHSC